MSANSVTDELIRSDGKANPASSHNERAEQTNNRKRLFAFCISVENIVFKSHEPIFNISGTISIHDIHAAMRILLCMFPLCRKRT